MQTYELKPMYDSRKSFYGKAKIVVNEGITHLISYDTWVARIENGKAVVTGLYSATTTRHIKEFLKQHNFKADNSKQIMKDYNNEN